MCKRFPFLQKNPINDLENPLCFPIVSPLCSMEIQFMLNFTTQKHVSTLIILLPLNQTFFVYKENTVPRSQEVVPTYKYVYSETSTQDVSKYLSKLQNKICSKFATLTKIGLQQDFGSKNIKDSVISPSCLSLKTLLLFCAMSLIKPPKRAQSIKKHISSSVSGYHATHCSELGGNCAIFSQYLCSKVSL